MKRFPSNLHGPAAAVTAALVGCALAPATTVDVPATLDPGARARLLMTASAHGVQVYECRAGAPGTAPAWTFVAPEAQLTDERGQPLGTHGPGPHWTALDGSRVLGTVRARADAPRPGAIAWLLLDTVGSGTPGRFSAVSHIQRVATEGGVAPADGCGPQTLGRLRQVPYRAAYRLFAGA